jgi:hypothetical protein
MPRGDSILNLTSYVVVFVLGAIAGGLVGLYVGLRISLYNDRYLDNDEAIYMPTLTVTCGLIGAAVGGVSCLLFALGHRHGIPTLHETRKRRNR